MASCVEILLLQLPASVVLVVIYITYTHSGSSDLHGLIEVL